MSELPQAHETVRVTFDTYLGAAEGLLLVLEDARVTECVYSFTGLSPNRILKMGLTLQGDVADLLRRVELISGSHTE